MDFVALAQECAPTIEVIDLAAIVMVQSGFDPYVIRTNSGHVVKIQPKNLDDAVKTATALAAQGDDIELGLGGVTVDALNTAGKGIKDAFEPCTNLKITEKTLNLQQAKSTNRDSIFALFYGRGDMQAGNLAGYPKVIDNTTAQISGKLDALQLRPGTMNSLPIREWTGDPIKFDAETQTSSAATSQSDTENETASFASWDVYGKSQSRAKVFF